MLHMYTRGIQKVLRQILKKTLNMVTKYGDYTCTILFGYHIQSFFLEFALELFECPSYC